MKRQSLVLFGLLLMILAFAGCAAPHEFSAATLDPPQPVPDFTLTALHDGEEIPVSLSDFQGDYVFLYFGYTFCPDVCPITLANLARVREELGEDADRMQVIMVTVDPERDTPGQLADYVTRFDPAFVGLSGSHEAITAAGQPFGLYYAKNEGSAATGYLVDHTSRTFLIDPDGNARLAFPHDATDEAILADLRYLMDNES